MKRKNVFVVIMVCLFFICTVASIAVGQEQGQKVWNLKYYSVFNPNMFEAQVEMRFFDSVKAATNGRVIMTPYWNASLMSRQESVRGLINGVFEIGALAIGDAPGEFPVSYLPSLPFMFKNPEEALNVLTALYKKGLMPEFNKIKLGTFTMTDMTYMAITKKEIKTLEDLKGLKIRSNAGITSEIMKALGATPVGMSFSDLYMAASRGMIDGFVSSANRIAGVKLNEVAEYFIDLPLFVGTRFIAMNLNTWNSFPDDIKAIMEKEFVKVSDDWHKENAIGEENSKKALQERGMKFITISPSELARWKQAIKPVKDEFIKNLNELGLQGQKIIDDAESATASK